jgi:hypothetical protein
LTVDENKGSAPLLQLSAFGSQLRNPTALAAVDGFTRSAYVSECGVAERSCSLLGEMRAQAITCHL